MCSYAQLRDYKKNTAKCRGIKKGDFKSYADLLNYVQDHKLPDAFEDFAPFALYAVDKMAEDFERYPNTMATVLVGRVNVGWVGQLALTQRPWALHADATHKFHIGGWALTTFGTHCLAWDSLLKVCLCSPIHPYAGSMHISTYAALYFE
jgi:hypothetical protein